MSVRLWFPLDRVLALAEHTHTHSASRSDAALVLVIDDGIYLTSATTAPEDRLLRVRADQHGPGTNHHRADSGANVPDGMTFLPLTEPDANGVTLLYRLRHAAAAGWSWLSLDMPPAPAVGFHSSHDGVPAPKQWQPALAAVDEFHGPYPALVAVDATWKGFAIPRFALDVVRRIAADTARLPVHTGPGGASVVRIVDGGVHILTRPSPSTGTEVIEVVEPDTDGLYRLGPSWAWLLVDGSENYVDDCACGTGCGCPDTCAVCDEPVHGGHDDGCVWRAGSAPYEQPAIGAQLAVLEVHRHRPGCPQVRRRPGPLIDDVDRCCTFCDAEKNPDAHTRYTADGRCEHHQRCTACGQTWSATATTLHR